MPGLWLAESFARTSASRSKHGRSSSRASIGGVSRVVIISQAGLLRGGGRGKCFCGGLSVVSGLDVLVGTPWRRGESMERCGDLCGAVGVCARAAEELRGGTVGVAYFCSGVLLVSGVSF